MLNKNGTTTISIFQVTMLIKHFKTVLKIAIQVANMVNVMIKIKNHF